MLSFHLAFPIWTGAVMPLVFVTPSCWLQVTDKSTMTTTAKVTRSASQPLAKQGKKLDLENYCAPGVRDLWMPMLILVLNLGSIFLGIYRLYKVSRKASPHALYDNTRHT